MKNAFVYILLLAFGLYCSMAIGQVSNPIPSYTTIQDEGTAVTKRRVLNFTGAGVNCNDNSSANRTDCNISSSSGGPNATDLAAVNAKNAAANQALTDAKSYTDTATASLRWEKYTNTTVQNVGNTNTLTTVAAINEPANSAISGSQYQFTALAAYNTHSSGALNVLFKVYCDSTVICQMEIPTTSIGTSTNNQAMLFSAMFSQLDTGASGNMVGTLYLSKMFGSFGNLGVANRVSAACNTTGPRTLAAKVTWGVANTANQLWFTNSMLERVK